MFKLLGLNFNETLNFSSYFDSVATRALLSMLLSLIRVLKRFVDKSELLQVFDIIVRFILEYMYASSLFVGISTENEKKIERI